MEWSIPLLADVLGDIFDKYNQTICSNCPIAKGGCCRLCKEQYGYFSIATGEDRLRLAQLLVKLQKAGYGFSQTRGFLSKEGKCRLPREKRSSICLEYCCKYLEDELQKKYGQQIRKFIIDMSTKIRELEKISRT